MAPLAGWWRYLAPLVVIAIIAVLPVPTGLESHTWLYFAVFTGVIVGLILEPVPGAVVAMIGISIIAVLSPWLLFSPEQLAQDGFKFTAKSLSWAVSGFSNSVIWLIFAAFMFGTGYEKTGLGRRIALMLVKKMGHRTLFLGYAVMFSELILAPVTPSNSARNRCDCINDRLYCCVVNISAKLAFCIYVDSYVDHNLSLFNIISANNACTACCYDDDVCFTSYRWHINGSCMADGYSCVFLNKHHCRRLANNKASSDYNCFFTCAVDSVMIQDLHTCLWCTWWEADLLTCENTGHGKVCHTVNVFFRSKCILDHCLIQMFRKRTEQKNAMNVVVFVYFIDGCKKFFLSYISRKKDFFTKSDKRS